jgi:hypothetical protein
MMILSYHSLRDPMHEEALPNYVHQYIVIYKYDSVFLQKQAFFQFGRCVVVWSFRLSGCYTSEPTFICFQFFENPQKLKFRFSIRRLKIEIELQLISYPTI